MTYLDLQGQKLLALLVGKLKNVVPERPETYIGYKDIHDELNLEQLGPTFGESLKHQGLNSLAEWTATEGKPAITGIIIDWGPSCRGTDIFDCSGRAKSIFNGGESKFSLQRTLIGYHTCQYRSFQKRHKLQIFRNHREDNRSRLTEFFETRILQEE